eukprot:gene57052-biopygen53791
MGRRSLHVQSRLAAVAHPAPSEQYHRRAWLVNGDNCGPRGRHGRELRRDLRIFKGGDACSGGIQSGSSQSAVLNPIPTSAPYVYNLGSPSTIPTGCQWTWTVLQTSAYCSVIVRKDLGTGMSIQACQSAALFDSDCRNPDAQIYGNGDMCRCVKSGQACDFLPSASGNTVYGRSCLSTSAPTRPLSAALVPAVIDPPRPPTAAAPVAPQSGGPRPWIKGY